MSKQQTETEDKVNTSLWIKKKNIERAENLVSWLVDKSVGGGRINKSAVLRLAIERGLDVLEFEASKEKK